MEDFRQPAPEPDPRHQPGPADRLLAHFSPDRLGGFPGGRHAATLPPVGAALHHGDHP